MSEWWEKHNYVYIQSKKDADITNKDATYQQTKLWLYMNYPQISKEYLFFSKLAMFLPLYILYTYGIIYTEVKTWLI